MQAMAEAPNPARTPAPTPLDTPPSPTVAGTQSLLAQFDYLSTVSGGGYLGAFFVNLFVPGRLRREHQRRTGRAGCLPDDAIRTAGPHPHLGVLCRHTGPGRRGVAARERPYLTPTGAGDNLYAAAVVVRAAA